MSQFPYEVERRIVAVVHAASRDLLKLDNLRLTSSVLVLDTTRLTDENGAARRRRFSNSGSVASFCIIFARCDHPGPCEVLPAL